VANLCIAAIEQLRGFALAADGINERIREINFRDTTELTELNEESVLARNISAELTDASVVGTYPALFVWCAGMDNKLERKFTEFSGSLLVRAELRVSAEDVDGLEGRIERYVEALTAVLGAHHGQWTPNLAFDGAYQARIEAMSLGGIHFLQTARVEIEIVAHA